MENDAPLTELCPKCGLRMFNWPGRLTKCLDCLHEWYMDTSKREDSADSVQVPK